MEVSGLEHVHSVSAAKFGAQSLVREDWCGKFEARSLGRDVLRAKSYARSFGARSFARSLRDILLEGNCLYTIPPKLKHKLPGVIL